MIHILADTCSDLSKDLLDQFKIDLIPLNVFINNRSYLDGIEISRDQLFDYVNQTGQLPKTSAPIVEIMTKFLDREGDVIYISIGSALSATYQTAMLAKNSLPGRNIFIVDSKNLSTGIGHLVVRAAELRDQGLPLEEILAEINFMIPRIRTSFVIDTLDYLYMGGRCSAMQHIVGSLLKIRPIIEVRQDGSLGVREKIGGSRKKALSALIEDFQRNASQINPHRVFITHTGCDSDAEYIRDEISRLLPIENLNITYAGSTISSHCGPDTIGILYVLR